jgi:anti-sigma regulatory factor (Ser/Thr protein kinase)
MCSRSIIELRSTPRSVAAARRFVGGTARSWTGGWLPTHRLQLIVSELVTNALALGTDPIEVEMAVHHGHLEVAVADAHSDHPAVRHAGPLSPAGRGLVVVGALSDAWGVRAHPAGKVVWARVELPPSGRWLACPCTDCSCETTPPWKDEPATVAPHPRRSLSTAAPLSGPETPPPATPPPPRGSPWRPPPKGRPAGPARPPPHPGPQSASR